MLLAGLLPTVAHAAEKPVPSPGAAAKVKKGEEHAGYDSREHLNTDIKHAEVSTKTAGLAAQRLAAAEKPGSGVRKLRQSLGVQGIVTIDKATGTPRRVAKLNGFLTGPSKDKPESIARDYVKAHADVFGLSAAAVDALTLRQSYKDIAGTVHLSFQQSVDGVAVFGNGLKVHVAKGGQIVAIDGSPIASLPSTTGSAKLTAEKARALAVEDVSGDPTKATVAKRDSGASKTTTFSDKSSAKLVMFQTAKGPVLAWQTVAGNFIHVVDDSTGTVLYRQNTDAKDNGLAWPNYPGAAVGGTQQVVDLNKLGLPPNASKLDGNVAHVYTDVNDNNVADPSEEVAPAGPGNWQYPFTDFNVAVGGKCSAQFQCSWDPKVANSWQKNREQNAVQLYYFVGTWHDHLNDSPIGFTRAAGNFEAADGDAVQVEALDGAATKDGLPDADHVDNANMNTPPDGTPPRMQMYLNSDPANPDDPYLASNNGDEADTVFHEYTHGLSNRLVTDADGVSALLSQQASSMGEAWSDWYSADYLAAEGLEPDTDADGDIRFSRYPTGGTADRSEATDCSVGSTSPSCPGTPTAGPGGYTYGDLGKIAPSGPESHADGEIWGQTLWDLRTAIGSKQAESLVTRAMELSPSDPSFLDERNAILQADQVVNGGKLQNTIWKVFANRGMGYFAGAINSADVTPVEDFSMPPAADAAKGSLTGKVSDSATNTAVAGATVEFGGHSSGFVENYATTTAADGTYTIDGILPGTYPKVFAAGTGYDQVSQTVPIEAKANTLDWSLRRDWAAASGGGKIDDPDGGGKLGSCGPIGLIDQSPGVGWSADVKLTGADDTTAIEPVSTIVKLPAAVDISELTINPSGTCGDGGSASTGDYKVETSPDGATWTLGAQGHFTPAQRATTTVALTAGTSHVQYIRYTMLSTQVGDLENGACPGAFSGCKFVDTTELSVYGTPVS